MKHIATIALFLLALSLAAQDSSHVQKTYKNGSLEEDYWTNTSGSKHGTYVKYSKNGKVYIKGQYKNGFPVGTWNYYTPDTSAELIQTLDFDTHKELFVDTSRGLICGPRYFGGNMLKQEYVQERIKTDFTAEERAKLKGKNIMAVFEVDSVTYNTYAITIEDNSITPATRAKLVKIIQEMPQWLPPSCHRGTMVWRMSVIFLF